jgi:hypothetical protein
MKISIRIPFIAKVKEALMTMSELLLLFFLVGRNSHEIIVYSKVGLIFYAISYALVSSLAHIGCQYLAILLSSKRVMQAVQEKKPLPPTYLLLPMGFEWLSDVVLLYAWNTLGSEWVWIPAGWMIWSIPLLIRMGNMTIDFVVTRLRKKKEKKA